MANLDSLAEDIANRVVAAMRKTPPTRAQRFSEANVLRLARSGVAKVDVMGPRGTTLCTMDEIEAMAIALAASGLLPEYNLKPAAKAAPEGD